MGTKNINSGANAFIKRQQNQLEPEYDTEYGVGVKHWPWVEKGAPVRDPNNPDCPGWGTPYKSAPYLDSKSFELFSLES
mgnify:CR=1 FL=1